MKIFNSTQITNTSTTISTDTYKHSPNTLHIYIKINSLDDCNVRIRLGWTIIIAETTFRHFFCRCCHSLSKKHVFCLFRICWGFHVKHSANNVGYCVLPMIITARRFFWRFVNKNTKINAKFWIETKTTTKKSQTQTHQQISCFIFKKRI